MKLRRTRRAVIAGAAAVAAVGPVRAAAQQAPLPILGVLAPTTAAVFAESDLALRAGLKEGGFVEGTNLAIAERYTEGRRDRFEALVSELAALGPRAIVSDNTDLVVAIHKMVPAMPLVSAGIGGDPVALGLAASVAHPGGTFTGLLLNASGGEAALAGKRIDLLHELVPGLKRLGVIGEATANFDEIVRGAKAAGDRLGIAIVRLVVRTMADVEAFYVVASPLLANEPTRVAEMALRAGKPTVGMLRFQAQAGLLMAYSVDLSDLARRAGLYATKILNGEKTGDLPIEMADKFTFTINLKTAKALGVEVGPKLLLLADEVVE
jgi:putative ABC transport system substrate-binding protein